MSNLQDLFDAYAHSNPSKGKLDAAVKLFIHICKALHVAAPEDLGPSRYNEIPIAIDAYFSGSHDAAIQDKSILAEMIGSYGPVDGWDNVLEQLLADKDVNLRQFVLQALEVSAKREPQRILPYIEQVIRSNDSLMHNIAAILVARIFCAGHQEYIKNIVQRWYNAGETRFIHEIYENIHPLEHPLSTEAECKILKSWLKSEFISEN